MPPILSFDRTNLLPLRQGSGFQMDDYWVWCGSVVRDQEGTYHMFASRWPRTLPFHPGWLTNSQVIRATSPTPDGPYKFAAVVFEPRGPAFWDGDSTHNPHITRIGDKYALFYMGTRTPLPSVAPNESLSMTDPRVIVARSNKRIGLALADHPAGPWKRLDAPILLPKPETFYDFFTSNPAPLIEADGSVLLVFKSRRYKPDRKHSDMMLGVAKAPRPEGPYEVVTPDPIFGGPGKPALEDPFIWRSERGIELIAKDMTGAYSGQAGAGMRAVSRDGIKWELDDPPHSWDRTFEFEDGSTVTVGSAERPFLLFDEGRPTHLFLSMSDGPGGFAGLTRTWIQAVRLRR